MTQTARMLASHGWILRTGGAEGADSAFLAGALEVDGCADDPLYELYEPWPGFCKHGEVTLERPTDAALSIASRYHPGWPGLKRAARLLHGRNSHIVLGRDVHDPVMMVVCWTPDGTIDGRGRDSGGTGQGLRVARGEAPDAVVLNVARPQHRTWVERFVDEEAA